MAEAVTGADIGLASPEPHVLMKAEEALEWALVYIESGWGVTAGPGLDSMGICGCPLRSRCKNPGKHANRGWGNKTRFTLTSEQAKRYWDPENPYWLTRPVDQVFIVPYLSGLVVADVDRQEAWDALDEEHRPDTLWQRSGSGRGGHYVYSYTWDRTSEVPPTLPGKLRNNAGEVKFRGIIAAYPSPHASGGQYVWQNWGTAAQPAPLSLVSRETTQRYGTYTWDTLIDGLSSTKPGEIPWIMNMYLADTAGYESIARAVSSRPTVTFAVAASMAKWVAAGLTSEAEVAEKVLDACIENGVSDDYGEAEIRRWVSNAIKAGMAEKRMEW